MNVVVLIGVVAREPEVRELPSGSVVWQFDLSVAGDRGTIAVPLAWTDPPSTAVLDAGDSVAVRGSVRRRFFRSGGSTGSRTEVVVEKLVKASSKQAVVRLLEAAGAAMVDG